MQPTVTTNLSASSGNGFGVPNYPSPIITEVMKLGWSTFNARDHQSASANNMARPTCTKPNLSSTSRRESRFFKPLIAQFAKLFDSPTTPSPIDSERPPIASPIASTANPDHGQSMFGDGASIAQTIVEAPVLNMHSSDPASTQPLPTPSTPANHSPDAARGFCAQVPASGFHFERQVPTIRPSVVTVDPQGDVRLLVKERKTNGAYTTKVFLVSSKALSNACDAWNALLNGGFKESQVVPSAADHAHEISFHDDDCVSWSILLNIAHLQFKKVPQSLDFDRLLNLTILTDKYGATDLLRPWAKEWVAKHEEMLTQPGYEDWLWVAWELGQTASFERLVAHLVLTVRVKRGKCVAPGGRILDPLSESDHLPPDIIENILEVRERTITRIFDTVYAALQRFIDISACGRPQCDTVCDSLTFGALGLALKKAGFRLEKMKAAEVSISITELHYKIRTIRTMSSQELCSSFLSCKNTWTSDRIRDSVADIIDSIPSALLDSHRCHLERQSEIMN